MIKPNELPMVVDLWDSVSGDRRRYLPGYGWMPEDDTGSGSVYVWEDGNFSCDCNRSLYLWDWDDAKELPCSGDTPRIKVRITHRETGDVLYQDSDFLPPADDATAP